MNNINEMENFLTTNEEYDRNNRIKRSIILIKENGLKKVNLSSLYRTHYYKGFYEFYINNDIEKAKQCFYLTGRFLEMSINLFEVNLPYLYKEFLALLLSDNIALIKRARFYRDKNFEQYRKNGNVWIILIQAVLRDDKDEINYCLEFFKGEKSKTEFEFFVALLNGDKKTMEKMIMNLLSPKIHKKKSEVWIIEKFSGEGLMYAKLAYLKGYELDIDHPLIPKELLPVKPNDEYWEYDFMKEGKYKDV